MKETIQFGSRRIDFDLEYVERKTLGISITPDLKVHVKAPVGSTIEKIKEKLAKRAPWIINQQSYFLTFQPRTTPRKFIGGETHLYLGRHYRLKMVKNEIESVKIKEQFIEIHTSDQSRAEELLKNWYLQNAKTKFHSLAESLIQKFKKYHVEPDAIVLRSMPYRWGSCTTKGKIILNPELIKAPRGCIEYVIIHELCHLIYHYHTRKFIDLQSKEMPDWEKWKLKLEKLLA